MKESNYNENYNKHKTFDYELVLILFYIRTQVNKYWNTKPLYIKLLHVYEHSISIC